MASVPKLLLLILVCSYFHSLVAHAGDARSLKVLYVDSMKHNAVCSEPKAALASANGTTVPLRHRHGPCSPVASNSKKTPTLEEMLQRDQLRAGYIQRKLSRARKADGFQQADASVPTSLGTPLKTLEYVISVGLGSPAAPQTVLIDTGSDVSWVRCKPCSQCHKQADPVFDPAASTTYAPFSCGSEACAQLEQEGNGCSGSQCQYIVRYGDGSWTTGTYSADTLKVGSGTLTGFQFGCSHKEGGYDDLTDGLMGLGGGAQSLASQKAGAFGSTFSYCLPPTTSSSGFLTLGAPRTSSGFVRTPMVSIQLPTFYGVRLQGIQVDGKQLDIPPSVFAPGSIMDSGTVITRLPPTAYSALSAAFKARMKQYPPSSRGGDFLDTCFDFSGQTTVATPTVALVFAGGAVVKLDSSGVLLESCLAFAPNEDDGSFGIIGNVQQRTFEVLYDVRGKSVGFRSGAC